MKLSSQEITDALVVMYGWEYQNDSIQKTFKTKGFAQTMAFVSAIGAVCQALDHHPDFCTFKYSEISISFSTHSEGGVTKKDIEIAKELDKIFSNGF